MVVAYHLLCRYDGYVPILSSDELAHCSNVFRDKSFLKLLGIGFVFKSLENQNMLGATNFLAIFPSAWTRNKTQKP